MTRLLNAWERRWRRITLRYDQRHRQPFKSAAVTTRKVPR